MRHEGEYEILDLFWEAMDETYPLDLYEATENAPRPAMYIEVDGECWRITAEHHPHV